MKNPGHFGRGAGSDRKSTHFYNTRPAIGFAITLRGHAARSATAGTCLRHPAPGRWRGEAEGPPPPTCPQSRPLSFGLAARVATNRGGEVALPTDRADVDAKVL